ncbi:motile sperm domain-containing protein 1-like isoform X1 [Haliotis cracherodii]|uniref:motile sperm domain-containing protein 1-like isoform X1 n=2 Tax=Haliotis cracherodii TaxID=6455 RepID=UPI0039EAB92D
MLVRDHFVWSLSDDVEQLGMQSPPSHLGEGKLPVFVFPSSLAFYSDDQATHKQVLTLYNPYDAALKFKVLSTAPRKYTVVDSEGTIRPRCCVDIVIRHIDICINNEGVKDKFRIQVSEYGQKKMLGRKDVSSMLLPRKDSVVPPDEDFQSLPSHTTEGADSQQSLSSRHGHARPAGSGPGFIVICAAIACIVALAMPSQGEKESRLPEYLHVSQQQKLIAAYILGLVTMVILRV